MDKTPWILLIVFVTGLVILLLTDNNIAVVSFNERHGPSFPDLAGLTLILASWLASTIVVVKRWNQVVNKSGRIVSYSLLIFYFLSLFGIILALSLSVEWLLWICTAIALAINIFFIISAFRLRQ
jgi:hypothetical protein